MGLKEILKKQGGANLLKQYWNGGAFFTAVGEFLLLGKSRTSLEILRNAASLKIKQNLEKEYSDKIAKIEKKYKEEIRPKEVRKVWICWFQGMEGAPEIVKRCYASVEKNITDREIILLTEKNYREYVTFPEEIQNKIDCGKIKGAHMSDLLRLELLQRYGGTWIDATVFCTSKTIPTYMLDSDLFLFQCLKPGRDGQPSTISNWFMTAKPNQKFIFMQNLLVPEIFHEGQRRKKNAADSQDNTAATKPVDSRKGFYPDDIVGTFGVPVEEHRKESEVQQMDGYVSMGILTGKIVPEAGKD